MLASLHSPVDYVLNGDWTLFTRIVKRLLVVVAVLLAAWPVWLWFAPIGIGEVRVSPDGRYTARAYNVSKRTLWSGVEYSIELSVIEKSSKREVWNVVRGHAVDEIAPQYGTRGKESIVWALDSKSVTIPVMDEKALVLDVP